jgi:hypothetical protein
MLIFLIGSGSLAIYQVMALEDQLDQVIRATDQMDSKVKHAEYEQAKFFALAKDVLRLAPSDPNAEKVATAFKLRQLQAARPALMDLNAPDVMPTPNAPTPSATSNSAPVLTTPATTNAPSLNATPLNPK